MESSKEIHETMILETKMSKKKNPCAGWKLLGRHVWSIVLCGFFRKFAVDYAYCPNSILQTEFLKYELMNLKIKLPRVYKKKSQLKSQVTSWIRKDIFHEIGNMKPFFYETWNMEPRMPWHRKYKIRKISVTP